jgi:hypothetical protein
MKKLLADRLLAMPQTKDAVIEQARAALKLPNRNHIETDAAGACDRFVLSDQFHDAIAGWGAELDRESRFALFSSTEPLLPQYWIDTHDNAWFVDDDVSIHFAVTGNGVIIPTGKFSFTQANEGYSAGTGAVHVTFFKSALAALQTASPDEYETARREAGNLVIAALLLTAGITSHRSATVRRIIPSRDTPAERAFARRQMQRGRPVFSYNKVDLIIPQTCIHCGDVVETKSLAGKRGHMVVGHWRLIAGVAEPFFTWIDGYERGDREPGYITKERHVVLNSSGPRHGFMVPNTIGRSGERRKAERA